MTVSTLFFGLLMLCIGLYAKSPEFWRIGPVISLPILVFVWILFLLIRYGKINGLLKAGICTASVGVFTFFADYFINKCIGTGQTLPVFRPFIWRIDTIDGNVKWLTLLGCGLVGMILIASGFIKGGKKKG